MSETRTVNIRSEQEIIDWGEDGTIIDSAALEEAIWRAKRNELDEALIMLVRAVPDLYNLLKLCSGRK